MKKSLLKDIIEIGKSTSTENIVIELFLPNFPLIKGSDPIFKINKSNTRCAFKQC